MRGRGRIAIAFVAALVAAGLLSPRTLPVRAESDGRLVAFAIDTSGSLRPPDVARAGNLAAGILDRLPPGTEAAIFTFDDQARLLVPRTANAEDVKAAVARLRPRGRTTAMNDALFDAARYLRDSGVARRTLVLVTDGRDEDSAVELADALAVAQQAGIPVFTVGVGRAEERVLRRIAKLTGGQYAALGTARADQLASAIAAFGPGAAAPIRTTGDRGESRPGPDTSASPAAEGPAAGEARGGDAVTWVAVVALAVAIAAAVSWVRRRRAAAAARLDDDLGTAPTLLERMNRTEEYLEKTVTLRERPVLTITRGPGAGQVYELGGGKATSIGRAKANEVVVNDVSVSSEHCRIRPEDGHFVLHDLRSTNGTFVNERRVTRHVLTEGDVVKIGETSLLFKTDLKRT